MNDPLKPSATLLCKLGSIAVHADEYTSPGGHRFDLDAIRALVNDADVRHWVNEMTKLALVPLKRSVKSGEAQ